jgi:hypothetical protein
MKSVAKLMFGALLEPRFYSLFGVVLLLVASVFLSSDQFTVTSNGAKRIVTRQHDPVIYWGTEGAIAFIGALLLAGGIYFERKSPR